jgi:hypothetical protein
MIDNLFLLAVGALGWGFSLATYRFFARRQGWPMGALQIDFPAVPVLIGLFALCFGLWFAVVRATDSGGWVILLFGALLALFWTGFLRVGSQISLILAPVATVLLIAGWLAEPLVPERTSWTGEPQSSGKAESLAEDRPGYRIAPGTHK